MTDFQTGDVIYQYTLYGTTDPTPRGPYTVDDPVRTKAGKLRLIGPRGGKMTTWWRKDNLRNPSYRLEVRRGQAQT